MTIKLQPNGLIGSKQDILNLQKSKSARILICSDSHGKYETLQNIIMQFGKRCDAFIFCGDIGRDIVLLINNLQSNKALNKVTPPVIAYVRGNSDPASLPLGFNKYLPLPPFQTLTAAGKTIFIAHGHNHNVYFGLQNLGWAAQENNATIAVYGHTHIPMAEKVKDFTFINPGSCNFPRGGFPPSFAILTIQDTIVDAAHIQIINKSDSTEYKIFTPFL